MSWFVVRKAWTGPAQFGFSGPQRHHEEFEVREAGSASDAITEAARYCSVLALEQGVTFQAVEVSWDDAETWLGKYDGPAMNDNHTPTGARLVVSRV